MSNDDKITVVCSILGVILAFLALFAGGRRWKKRDNRNDDQIPA